MRWRDELHGVWLAPAYPGGGFSTRQLRFGNTAKLELLAPEVATSSGRDPVATSSGRDPVADGFAERFLARYGPRIHHVTLKVPDLREAAHAVRAAGLDVVDESYDRDEWHEAFLRPGQVGGIVVQLARALHDDEGWARLAGVDLPAVDPAAPALLGPTLTHPDLDEAAHVWSTLGAHIEHDEDGEVDAFEARWPDAMLSVRVERDVAAGPRGLRFSPDPGLPGSDVAGPPTLPG